MSCFVLRRRVLSGRGAGQPLILADTTTAGSMSGVLGRYAARQITCSTAAATTRETSAMLRLQDVSLQRAGGASCSSCGSRSVPRRSPSRGSYCRPYRSVGSAGVTLETRSPPERGPMLLRPPWVMKVVGLQTSTRDAGSNDRGDDQRVIPQMKASSSSATTAEAAERASAGGKAGGRPSSETSGGGGGDDARDRKDHQAAEKTTGDAAEGGKVVEEDDDGVADPAARKAGVTASLGEQARRMAEIRERLRDARLDASEDAKDWIRDKRDDVDEMREVWSGSLVCPSYLLT